MWLWTRTAHAHLDVTKSADIQPDSCVVNNKLAWPEPLVYDGHHTPIQDSDLVPASGHVHRHDAWKTDEGAQARDLWIGWNLPTAMPPGSPMRVRNQ